MCIYIHTHTHIYIHTPTYKYIFTYIHLHSYIHIHIYTPIYICMYVYFRFCVWMVHVLFNLGLNLSLKVLSFICSNVLSLFWKIGIILNFPLLHRYRCFETLNFMFSSIFLLLLWSDVLVLSACVDPMYISLHSLHLIMYTTFFLDAAEVLYLFWIWFQGF